MTTTTLLDEVAKHRKEIKNEVLTYALSELASMHGADPPEMKIQPEWQRLFRWTREQQSTFIESLILEIPIPPLFFFENENGQWELLDGLQRVSTILKFMATDRDVPPEHQGSDANENSWHYEHENDIAEPLQLVATDYLPSLEGLSFERLPSSLRLNLKRSRIQIYVLKRETHRMHKYEVFKRLNRGGSILEEQELRNCAVRILGDTFPAFIKELGANADFLACLALDTRKVARGYADELALRYLTMKNYGTHFRHDVAPLLTQYMEQVTSGKVEFDYAVERNAFERLWCTIARIDNPERLFRAVRKDGTYVGILSPTYFELVSLAVGWHLDAAERLSAEELGKSLRALIADARENGVTGAGSNSRVKTQGRLDLAKAWRAPDDAQ